MNNVYYSLNKFDKEIYANIYLLSIDELHSIFNIIPNKKIKGPPDDFPYFKKIIQYIYDIIILFQKNDSNIKQYMDDIYYCKNNKIIVNIIESLIDNYYQFSKINIHIFCRLFDIYENLYIIANFFNFNICNKLLPYYVSNYDFSKVTILVKKKYFTINTKCVTYIEFYSFISNDGYNKKEYWSDEGLKWLNKYPKKHPYFWVKNGYNWYIKKFDKYIKLQDISEQPIENISYYEAEAYCKYLNVYLPKLEHLKQLFIDTNYSNNVCEWTSTKYTNSSNICFGRSFYNKVIIKNVNDTQILNKSAQHYFTGFRYILEK